MPRFFVSEKPERTVLLDGADGRHIVKSLRMRPGEHITLCDSNGTDYDCVIQSTQNDSVQLQVLRAFPSRGEPSLHITLYQSLPKANKMDSVVQKAVECGVGSIVPVLSARCVSRPDAALLEHKCARWQKIAEEAAKQCGRGRIPPIQPAQTFSDALTHLSMFDDVLFFYENGGESLRKQMPNTCGNIAIFIGPEGGFADQEAFAAQQAGLKFCTLGPRILRTETAPIAALSALLLLSGDLEVSANG